MSWRTLFIFLLLAIAASWQGGRQLGLWLVEQAPESIASATNPANERGEVLDADGKPLAPQPPQPRIDGTLGVPKEMEPIEWTITTVIASREDANSYKKDGENEDEDDEENRSDQDDPDRDRSDPDGVRTVDVRSNGSSATSQRPVTPTPAPLVSWQDSLRAELAQCNNVGFFKRPGCRQTAQTKYCGPNNAWGKIPECPDNSINTVSGG